MHQDTLYLLKTDFIDNGQHYYCPACAEVAGILAFYPALKAQVQVRHVDFPRPRPELAALLGEANQSCPVLVLAKVPANLPSHLKVHMGNNHAFVEGAREIGDYFAHVHGTPLPH
jgi:hypothetical protein